MELMLVQRRPGHNRRLVRSLYCRRSLVSLTEAAHTRIVIKINAGGDNDRRTGLEEEGGRNYFCKIPLFYKVPTPRRAFRGFIERTLQ